MNLAGVQLTTTLADKKYPNRITSTQTTYVENTEKALSLNAAERPEAILKP